MRLRPLEIGRLDTDLRIITGAEGSRVLPVPAWFIEHDDGLVLFDTGMHASIQQNSDRLNDFTKKFFRPDFNEGEELTARLDGHGIRASDITHVIFSHLHFDHAGGTCEIPDARIVIQKDEWEAAHTDAFIELGIYDPTDYDLGHDVQQVEGEHDVFGDGRMVTVPTPGHTPGHQALRLELDSGPVVLTADCIYYEQMLTDMTTPELGTPETKAQQLESMQHLKSLRDDHGCHLLFGHDKAQLDAFPKAGMT